MGTISKIKRVQLREVWKHEARDFTQWLQTNLDVLGETVDISLVSAEREQRAGTFSVDLVAEDAIGNPVVIENQLEKSDHDHLGKIITYLVSVGAKVGIWIVSNPRPEHIAAISWLNESDLADFYLVKVEAITIDESSPAPLMTLIAGPTTEGREIGKTKKDLSERHHLRFEFWSSLLERFSNETNLFDNISPSHAHWISKSAGKSGLSFSIVLWKDASAVELYIDRGKDKGHLNESIYDQLITHKEAIENDFGSELEWELLSGKRACRIKKKTLTGGLQNRDKWGEIIDNLVKDMILFEKSLRPHIDKLKVD